MTNGMPSCWPCAICASWYCVSLATKRKRGTKNIHSHKSVFKAAIVCPLNMDSCNCQNKH